MIKKVSIAILTLTICLWASQSSYAQSTASDNLIPIGVEKTLEIIPAVFEDQPEYIPFDHSGPTLVVVPPVFETITETITIVEGYEDIVITPAQYDDAGNTVVKATARTVTVPPKTKDVTRRIIAEPATVEERVVPAPRPRMRRVQVEPETAIIRNGKGEIIAQFTDMEELADYINSTNSIDP